MASTSDLLVDALDRVRDLVARAADGLTEDELARRLDGVANSIAWLLWHLTRIQDDHVAELTGAEQVWTSGGWADRFGLPFAADETGYSMGSEQVSQVRASAELLVGYHDAVHEESVRYLRTLSDADLDEVVDDNWDPPVTRGVRLVSVVSDDLQHVGQAAFARGLL
jgi:uncharacterized damage-inducible protein DinB